MSAIINLVTVRPDLALNLVTGASPVTLTTHSANPVTIQLARTLAPLTLSINRVASPVIVNLTTGAAGKSAYALAQANGYAGTLPEWLASLQGVDGLSAYQLSGFIGTQAQWLASLVGDDGADAYHVALAAGFVGTQAAWLLSLKGADSTVAGPAGTGKNWIDITLTNYLALSPAAKAAVTIVYNVDPLL